MPVLVTDCKKGDIIFFRHPHEPEGTTPPGPMGRLGTIKKINRRLGILTVACQAVIDGQLRNCSWRIPVQHVIGFHVV